jgi:CheY-like chemotaxis protein
MDVKKILCIEDDTFLLNLISGKLFTNAGFRVVGAHNGSEGIAVAKSEMPDLILLDLMLPDISGAEVMRVLKDDEDTKKIPIIIFSNLGAREEIEKDLKAGAVAYLVKSNTLPGELAGAISAVLGIHSIDIGVISKLD